MISYFRLYIFWCSTNSLWQFLRILFQPLSELGDFTTGGLSKLSYGTLTDVGGTTLVDLSNGINNVVCTKFGPNFLKILLKNHTCSSEAIAPTKCGTWPEFCKLYNNAPPCIQDCLSTSAIDIEMKLNGLVGGHERLGKCCCKRDLVQVSMKYFKSFTN